jgi:hypothetical protein
MSRPLMRLATLVFVWLALAAPAVRATVNDSLSFALQAADPCVKEGFSVRQDHWGGDLGVKDQKGIAQQLFRGLEYWFWLGTEIESAKVSVHIYDQEGNLAEVESHQKKHFAAARIIPKRSGTYYVVVTVEASTEERTPWALAYGYR